MAIRPILHYPDERLYRVAQPVSTVDALIQDLVRDMAETMYAAPGVGLAATQIDVHQRIIVIDVSEARDRLLTFINPKIVFLEGKQECDEGCLSVPGIYEPVTRASKIRVEAIGADGKKFSLDAEGLLAVCIQHEIDHLDGKVFVDYLSRLKQSRIRAKMLKRQREATES
jgi:peptide deformylase